ncbi:glycosyltransferase family 4 protein [Roseomonas sp. HF4]|uniref:glycosyltransferase family 4 protein n=1 Tax=Roseomonas sp. HF4 TaxID=2562313 RepID=UPI0010C05723|nr:glycosyltransferase family 4 protein [Roseomonas sp. HF4]
MTPWKAQFKPALAQVYSRACAQYVRLSVGSAEAERSFGRVAIVAALGRNNGIANGARLQHAMLRRMGVDAELIDAGAVLRNPLFRSRHTPASAYVVHCGGPQTAQLLTAMMPAAARAWRIGYWAWELPDPPRDWHGFDSLLHEVWTPSRFSQRSLRRLTDLPMEVVPHVVPVARRRTRDGACPFTVLCFGDSRSSFARKNPMGAIAAFRAAFGDSPGARLVVKLNGGAEDGCELARAAAGCANVTILRDFLDADALARLHASADVLLSLHRAEGFGLPMIEAMGHGVPVIATAWSGNLDFMDGTNAVLVPARLVPVVDDAGIYRDSVWAEPDLDVAAAALRGLAQDPERWSRLSVAAHAAASALARQVPTALLQPRRRRDEIRATVAARMAGPNQTAPTALRGAPPAWEPVQGEHG